MLGSLSILKHFCLVVSHKWPPLLNFDELKIPSVKGRNLNDESTVLSLYVTIAYFGVPSISVNKTSPTSNSGNTPLSETTPFGLRITASIIAVVIGSL